MKKICIVTGSRAEYGLLRWVIEGVENSSILELQLVATGMHLSHEFGMTVNEIRSDGFFIDRKIVMLLSSGTEVGVTKSFGLGVIGFADALADLRPDLMLILGDRFEIMAAAVAAMIAKVPIAHLHGGEATEGLIDESIRHSITKMSHLHFVAAEEYRKRVIQLGEQENRVFRVGGLGIDAILNLQFLSLAELEKDLKFSFLRHNLLVTFHPVTLEQNTASSQMDELLDALAELEGTGLIFTMPNADAEGAVLFAKIKEFCAKHPNSRSFTSLGHLRYLSCMKYVDGIVGNSSSGLIEAPSLKKGTINIGDRQRGRLRADSVIDCDPTRNSISSALKRLFSTEFQSILVDVKNPYGNGGASDAIIKILEATSLQGLLKKRFNDRPS